MDGYGRAGLTPPEHRGAEPTGPVEPRRTRDSLFLLARLRLGASTEWTDVRVRNLSAGGLMAEISNEVAIDTPAELELRGIGRVRGRIAWQAEGRAGIAFDTEIDPLKARKPVGKAKATAAPSTMRR